MKTIARMLLFLYAISLPVTVSAGTMSEYLEAKKIFLAAGACMAAYTTRPGSLAIAAFEQQGWHVEPFKNQGEKADAKYLLAWDTNSKADQDFYLLAIAGTESLRDAKVDLRTKKVYFAGTTLEEFAANAARNDLPPGVPRVHEGFNQATQVLLSAKSAQANDQQAGTERMVPSILKEDSEDKLYLVGHSLGGAVVTLAAARLLDMGVHPGQIEVITFGAPAVGNEAFVQKYDGKFAVTRIVLPRDPIPEALRKVFGGYRHIGNEVKWPLPDILKSYFSHDISVYVDLALKNYYSKRRAAINEGLIPRSEPMQGKNRLYVAAIKNNLLPALQSEFSFMQEALWEEYDSILPGCVTDSGEKTALSEMEAAAAAGCTLLVAPEIQAVRVRDDDTYYISLTQTVYRVSDGTTVNAGIYGGNTKELTPLGALINEIQTMRRESAAWAEIK